MRKLDKKLLQEYTFKSRFVLHLIAENIDITSKYKRLDENFKNSAYKHVLSYEDQNKIIVDLENEILDLKEKLAIATNDDKLQRAVDRLRERRNKQ
jgi:hypothetical protein